MRVRPSHLKNNSHEGVVAAPFFNSFMRETNRWHYNEGIGGLVIPIGLSKSLVLGVKHKSLLGRNRFDGTFKIIDNSVSKTVSLVTAAHSVAQDLASLHGLSKSAADNLKIRFQNSLENIALSQKEWPEIEDFTKSLNSYLRTEQALIYGHSFHPTPKSKGGISPEDHIRFSPEFRKAIKLRWYLVSQSKIQDGKANTWDLDAITNLAFFEDPKLLDKLEDGYSLMVLHPFQEKCLLKNDAFLRLIEKGLCREIECRGQSWYATSSVRTLYAPNAPFQLKFSLGMKLTNSMRYLSVEEVDRGLLFQDVFEHSFLSSFKGRFSHFEINHEPSYRAIIDSDDDLVKNSLVSFRINTFVEDSRALGNVASLTQFLDDSGGSMILNAVDQYCRISGKSRSQGIKQWFHSFLDCALFPLIHLATKYGIYGSAHSQNLVLEFVDGIPKKCFFRDCQGTWYDPETHSKLKRDIPSMEKGSLVFSQEKSAILFSYYVVVNSTFNVITALAAQDDLSEKYLIDQLRGRLEVYEYKNPHRLLDYLLHKKDWMYKGNFMCTLRNLDEVSQKDPFSIYSPIENPLYVGLEDHDQMVIHPPGEISPIKVFRSGVKWTIQSQDTAILILGLGENSKANYPSLELLEGDLLTEKAGVLVWAGIEAIFTFNREDIALNISPELQKSIIESNIDVQSTVSRESFFQQPLLYRYHRPVAKEGATDTGKNRPTLPDGLLYRRYFPIVDLTVSLETFDLEKHLDLFVKWQNTPRVSNFWELNQSKSELQDYIYRLKADPHIHPVILNYEGKPIGYFELYWCLEDRLAPYYDVKTYDRGMHLLIGEEKYLGFKYTYTAWTALQHFLFLDEPRSSCVMLEPRADNENLLKYVDVFENICIEKEFEFPHKTAKLIRCDRLGFFNGRYL